MQNKPTAPRASAKLRAGNGLWLMLRLGNGIHVRKCPPIITKMKIEPNSAQTARMASPGYQLLPSAVVFQAM